MSALRLFLFGPPRVELDGTPVDLNRRKALALLIYLAASGQPHGRDALATLFYPDNDQRRARAYLRRDLAVVNTSLAGEWLDTDRETVELKRGDDFWLDIDQFRQRLAACQAHAHPLGRLCAQCLALLGEAVQLYPDDFLAGFTLRDCPEFDEWQFFQAESLRQELAVALERYARGGQEQGDPGTAIPYARRWVALDPLHEPAQHTLIQLYDQAGQPSAALRQYEEYRSLLEEELGLPPGEEIRTLFEAIKAKRMFEPHLRAGQQKSRELEKRPADSTPKEQKSEPTVDTKQPEIIPAIGVSPFPPPESKKDGVQQQIHYCHTPEGVRLAYATAGSGPPLVKAANWLSHLEYDWQSPVWRHWLVGLARHHTLIRYDERGCGLSDWAVEDFSLEAWVRDLETVVDAAGLERFPLLGISQGGPIAISYAIRHPERVSHLILYGTLFRGRLQRELTPQQLDEAQTFLQLIRVGWGQENPAFRQVFTSMFMPEATAEQQRWFNELQRVSTSPENALRIANSFNTIDARPLGRQVTTPTLVLHATGDVEIPFSEGQLTADLIPGARLVPLESNNHILLEQEPAFPQFLDAVHQFLQTDNLTVANVLPGKMASPPPAVIRSSTAPKSQPPHRNLPLHFTAFVGRQQELAQLDGWLTEALAGFLRIGFVAGDAGQGKTALLQALASRALATHPALIVVGGNCNAYTGTGDPYLPFREILELLTGDFEAKSRAGALSQEQVQRLHNLFPAVMQAIVEVGQNLIGTFLAAEALLKRATANAPHGTDWLATLRNLVTKQADRADDPNIQQAALFEQYTKVLQAIARQTPLLLILDDLQWADLGSINLLFHLGRRLKGFPILILGAYRPNELAADRLSERDGRIEKPPLASVIKEFQRDLGGISLNLENSEGRGFIDLLLDAEPNRLGADFREALYQLTNGHPLFTVELLRGMQERGDLTKDETSRWMAQPGVDWTALPPRVEGAIGARISRLEPALQKLLHIASIEGETFTAEIVAQVLQMDVPSVIDQFSQVLDRIHYLVRADGIGHDGELRLSRYRFRHILIQRYLYQNLDEIERAHHHEAVSRAFESLYDQRTDQIVVQLAHHYSAANIPEKARIFLHQAGDHARRAAALAEACRYYEAALALWPETEQAERAGLLRQVGECQWVLGQLQDALTSLETCYSLYMALDNQEKAGLTQLLIGRLYWEQGNREESLRYHERALATLEELPESIALARAASAMSQMHMLAAEYDQASAWGERALELADRLGAKAVTAYTQAILGDVYSYTGQQERGLAMLRDSLQLSLSLGLPHEACRAYLLLGESQASDGRYSEAQATLAEMEKYAAQVGASLAAGSAVVEQTRILWLTGKWQVALSNRQKILDWDKEGQSLSYLQAIAGNLFGRIYNDLGQANTAWQVLQETVSQVQGQDELQTLGPHLAQSARALVELGRTSEATEHLHQLLALIQRHQYDHVSSITPLLYSCGWFAGQAAENNESRPLDQAKTSLQLLTRLFNQTKSSVAEAALNEGKGIVALVEGAYEEATQHYRNAAGGWQKLGRPYDQARALHGLALALARNGKASEARAKLDWATSILDVLASQLEETELRIAFLNAPLMQQVRQARSELGIIPPTRLADEPAVASNGRPLPNADPLPQHNLPLQPTEFIGRDEELIEIRRLLVEEPACRLLTLTGPGGIGKTRLAIEAAFGVVTAFADGVFFVPLAPLNSAEPMVATIAERVGFPFGEGREPKPQLLDYLRQKQMLLVMDNFEHVLAGATLLAEILQIAPQVNILVTSRERLNLQGETIYSVNSLDVPDTRDLKDTLAFDAAQLFLQQARQVKSNFEPQGEERGAIKHICRLTQGMPLALVLAAGWLSMLSVKEIAAELTRSLDFLETEMGDVPHRQRSVRAAFDYSWKRLSPAEQQIFMKLSVFRGGFTRQAAERVTGGGLRQLRTLANKSLISIDRQDRYEMHELLRQFAADKLREVGNEEEVTRTQHSVYFLDFLKSSEAALLSRGQKAALVEIDKELENIRMAWQWAIQHDQVEALDRASETLYRYFQLRNRYHEGEEIIAKTINHFQEIAGLENESALGKLLARQGALRFFLGDYATASAQLERSLAIARRFNCRHEEAFILNILGQVAGWRGQAPAAKELLEQSLALSLEIDDKDRVADVMERLAQIYVHLGEYAGGKELAEESLTISRQLDRIDRIAKALDTLGFASYCLGEYEESERYYQESLTAFQTIGDQNGEALAWGGLGLVASTRGDDKAGEVLANVEKGLASVREIGHQLHIASRLTVLGWMTNRMGEYGRAQQYSQEGLAISRKLDSLIFIAYNLGILGNAASELGELQLSRKHLLEALRLTSASHLRSQLLETLLVYAKLLFKESELISEDQPERLQTQQMALAYLELTLRHPNSRQDVKDRAGLLLTQLEAELPAAVVESVKAKTKGQAVDVAVAEILDCEQATDPGPNILPRRTGLRFVQAGLIATGGMGCVYLGRDVETGQPVAIKRLKSELVAENLEAVKRFVREGEALRRLHHPNIVKVLATFEDEDQPVIVMEYVPNGSLQDLLDRQPQLPVERVLEIGLELADALTRVHHLGIIHRDLKPANVLLAEDGTPRLTDFGVAYLAQPDAHLTQEGTILGTSVYLSPEAWRGETLDARSDVWSFGTVLYEMLAGRPPFVAEHPVAIMTAILNDPVPDLLQFRPDTPPTLVELIKQMLVKEREQRLDSMRQVAAGLELIQRITTVPRKD